MTDDELLAAAEAADEEAARGFQRRRAAMGDYRYDKAQTKYWDIKAMELYSAEAVDASVQMEDWPTRTVPARGGGQRVVPIKPSNEIARIENGLMVDGSTWWPGKPMFIQDQLVGARGEVYLEGALTINIYSAPDHSRLKHTKTADKWVQHVKTLFPDEIEHEHFFDYAAHMLQKPQDKVNHGVVISGQQGIGKDTALLPLRRGVGLWNTAEIGPDNIEDRFNGYLKSVMLVVNEVRPHNEEHRASAFYNRLKPLLAAPPELLPMEMKQAHLIYVRNVLRVFLTTNDQLTLHCPPEDRRLFIMHSCLPQRWHRPDYFEDMFRYFEEGGADAAVHWLLLRDISNFKPGDTPPMTVGKEQVIASSQQVRRDIISDAFDAFVGENEPPDVFFPVDLILTEGDGAPTFDDKGKLVAALKARNLHFRAMELGYVLMKNPEGPEWKATKTVDGKRVEFRSRVAFIKKTLPTKVHWDLVLETLQDRLAATISRI